MDVMIIPVSALSLRFVLNNIILRVPDKLNNIPDGQTTKRKAKVSQHDLL